MSMNQPDIEQLQRAVATSLHEHWVLFLIEGIILVILGLVAIVIPPIATLAVEILFGWLFLISGIAGLITTFWMRQAPGFWCFSGSKALPRSCSRSSTSASCRGDGAGCWRAASST